MTSRRRTSTSTAPPRPKPGLSREAKVLLMLGAPVVLLAAVVMIVVTRSGSDDAGGGLPSSSSASSGQQQGILVREDSPVWGTADAPVTIVEFLDPECEACRAAYPGIKRLLGEYEGKVRLVVHYFPLHRNSILAAQATEAAGEQGKYWEMQELLFNTQPEWGEKDTAQTERFIEYARGLGLDVDQFTAVVQSGKYAAKVERDRLDGAALAVRGTPTVFVNGRPVRDFGYAGLKSAIDAALGT